MTPLENIALRNKRKQLLLELQDIETQLRKTNVPDFVDAAAILQSLKNRDECIRLNKPVFVSRDNVRVTFNGLTYTSNSH